MNDGSATACITSDDGSDIKSSAKRPAKTKATSEDYSVSAMGDDCRSARDTVIRLQRDIEERLHMTVITSKLIEGDGAPVREAPVHVWGENQLGRANRMKEFFKAATASVAILGAAVAFGAMTASSRFRRDDRIFSKRRRLLPQGRHRPHDGLRLRQHGTMPGGIVWSRRRLFR